jgi:histone H3/H4
VQGGGVRLWREEKQKIQRQSLLLIDVEPVARSLRRLSDEEWA